MSLALEIEQEDTIWDGAHSALEQANRTWLGLRAGQHQIVKHLGSGGMGHVFLAEHVTLGARAAVKILPAKSTAAQKRQFQQEAWLLAAQNHPNIVHLLDTGTLEDGSSYLLMEYAAGIDLECWLQQRAERSVSRVLRILRQVACAIDHLHAQGILHRDVKPANIVIQPEAEDAVKLLDFGIATREGQQDAHVHALVFGTPAYMAPEQAAGAPATPATDIYALGALALELLTGKPPYDYPSIHMTLAAVLHEKPSAPSERGLCVPGLDRFFERALAREPEQRFESGHALIAALSEVTQSATGAAARTARSKSGTISKLEHLNEARRGRRRLRGTALAAVSGITWYVLGCAACSSGEPPESARSSGAEVATDKPAAGPATEPEPESDLQVHMQSSFAAATRGRDALIDGDLLRATRAGDRLANMDYARVMPQEWMHWVGRIQERARELGIAPNLRTASQELAQIALICGDCHYQHREGKDKVREPPRPWTDPSEQIEDRMLRHGLGAEQMWKGLVFASEEAFRSGTLTLTRAPFTPPQHAGETLAPALATRIDEVRALAREARAASTHEERARVYGELIARCADCHYLARPAR